MAEIDNSNRRREERKDIKTSVEYIVSADVIEAMSMNISEHGIQLDSKKALEIEMRYTFDEKEYEHRARLRWVKQNKDGSFSFGFEYAEDE